MAYESEPLHLWEYLNIPINTSLFHAVGPYTSWNDFISSGWSMSGDIIYWNYTTREEYLETYRTDLAEQNYTVDLQDPRTIADYLVLMWITSNSEVQVAEIYVSRGDEETIRTFLENNYPQFYKE